MNKPQPKKKSGRTRKIAFYVATVGVLALVCFYPVTKYFFAQDDFILLANAVFDKGSSVGAAFGSASDLFRPLTKILYFDAAHGIFGLNPFPYHVVSLVIHVLNVVLVFILLRRFRIDRLSSIVVSAFFAFHTGFFDVVAWISCIQQLAGQAFMLAGLILGIRAMGTKRLSLVVLSLLCYALALLSLEQAYALAPLLFLHAYFREKTGKALTRAAKALRDAGPYLVLMSLYLLYMGVAKGVPEEGPYQFHFGTNVLSNLLTYLDWVLAISVAMPFIVDVSPTGLTAAHLVLALLVVYNLAKGRKRIVLFSSAYYLLTILPVLFLDGHMFHLHNYVPAVGIVLLAAPVVEDFFEIVRHWNARFVPGIAVLLVGLVALTCLTKVRVNETNYLRPDIRLPKDFVLRRAVVARTAYEDLTAKTRGQDPPDKFFMVYNARKDWYMDNVVTALGRGSALKLFFSDPDLDVTFHEKGDTLYGYDPGNSRIFFFDHMGRCMTPEEMNTEDGSPVQLLGPQ